MVPGVQMECFEGRLKLGGVVGLKGKEVGKGWRQAAIRQYTI